MKLLNIFLAISTELSMKQHKFRSNFEVDFANLLKSNGISYTYEPDKFEYVVTHSYTPDFKITSDIYIETKGLFTGSDRMKMLTVRKQHPEIQIILCLMSPNQKLSKASKTTYRQWCDKNNFIWCEANLFSIRNAITKAFRNRLETQENIST